ncbi:HAD family hydrolase [Massiliimalia timonensis]|uniref:HAD family hydrolase n=1 Tax=Massiliimalia timonensis TaxID=1987501 RepID=UPI000B8B49EE|nr:HAD-IA family hydrolase [Massiliimalia timonensis]
MIRYVGFDMDGTLADTLTDATDAVNFGLSQIHCPPRSEEEVQSYMGDSVYELIRRAMAPVEDEDLLVQAKQGFDTYYEKHFCDKTHLYPGIHELCKKLTETGIQLFVFSNKQILFVQEMLQRLLPEFSFAAVLGNHENFPPKPDPQQFLLFQEREGFSSRECVLIGDSNIDIATAHRANIYSVGVLWGYGERKAFLKEKADLYTDSAEEIYQWITKQ